MQTKREVNRVFLLILCSSIILPASAVGASTRLAQILAPCIDDQTFAVVHLDVIRLSAL